jgi:hypothetical protein
VIVIALEQLKMKTSIWSKPVAIGLTNDKKAEKILLIQMAISLLYNIEQQKN